MQSDGPSSAGAGANPGLSDLRPSALQILTTEHWSLLSARSLAYTESLNRVSLFVAALSGAVVALALVSQATHFDGGFTAFALVLLPVVFFLGVVTIVRLGQINHEDAVWVQGMNRIRNAYIDEAPELEPYFVTSRFDDAHGVRISLAMTQIRMPLQAFVAIPGVVAVLDSVVAAAIVGIALLAAGRGTAVTLTLAALGFCVSLFAFTRLGARTYAAHLRSMEVRFPSTETVRAGSTD